MSRELDFIDFINENADVKQGRTHYQDRNPNAWTIRSALATLSAEDVENLFERDVLLKYQDTLRQLNSKEQELYDTQELLRNMYAGDDQNYLTMQKDLQESASRIVSQIDALDRDLRDLQEDAFLNAIIEREKAKWYQREDQRMKEVLDRYREKAAETQKELMARYQESRRQAIQKNSHANANPAHAPASQTPQAEQRKDLKMTNPDGYYKKMLAMLLPMALSITLPLLMLDAPVWLMTIVDLILLSPMLLCSVKLTQIIPFAYYIINPIIYISALVVSIQGPQDFFAIAFYILMGIQAPRMIKNFIGTTLILYYTIVGDREQ